MPTNWISTTFRELKHILWKIDQDDKRYLKEPKLHPKPRRLFSFIFVIRSLEGQRSVSDKTISPPDCCVSPVWTDLQEAPWFTLTVGFTLKHLCHCKCCGEEFFLSCTLIWKHTIFYNTKNTMTRVIWGICSICASCGTFLAALSLHSVCVFLQREWVLCKASTHSDYLGADQ